MEEVGHTAHPAGARDLHGAVRSHSPDMGRVPGIEGISGVQQQAPQKTEDAEDVVEDVVSLGDSRGRGRCTERPAAISLSLVHHQLTEESPQGTAQ